MRYRALLLVCCCLVAGCSGASPDTETATPFEVTERDGIPGLRGEVVDATALSDAHDGVLLGTSYTVVVNETIATENRTLRTISRYRQVAPAESAYASVRRHVTNGFPSSTLGPRVAYWYNGSVTALRYEAEGDIEQSVTPATGNGPLYDPSNHAYIGGQFAAFDLTVTRHGNGTVRLDGRLADPDGLLLPSYLGNATAGRLNATVAPSGVVRSYSLRYNATFAGATVRVDRRVRFERLGNTTVDRPAWVEQAAG